MTSPHTTTYRQDAPFMIPGNAFAALLAMASGRLGLWMHARRERRHQRRKMRELRGLSDRTLRDIGVSRSEITYRVMQNGQAG